MNGVIGATVTDVDLAKELTNHSIDEVVAELEAALDRYRSALSGGHVGIWETDLDRGTLAYDPATENLFGLAPGEFAGTRQAFYDRVREIRSEMTRIKLALPSSYSYQRSFVLLATRAARPP